LVERVAESAGGDDSDLEITAILVGRTGAEESSERFGADAVARAAAAFDSGSEREEGEIATGEG
jgi:hypothetical protein